MVFKVFLLNYIQNTVCVLTLRHTSILVFQVEIYILRGQEHFGLLPQQCGWKPQRRGKLQRRGWKPQPSQKRQQQLRQQLQNTDSTRPIRICTMRTTTDLHQVPILYTKISLYTKLWTKIYQVRFCTKIWNLKTAIQLAVFRGLY